MTLKFKIICKIKVIVLPSMLIHTAEEKDTRRKLDAAMMAQNNTRMLKNRD